MKIVSPTLVLDKAKCLKNIEKMAKKAKDSGIGFRPHFKTHQSREVGNWFRDFGVDAITVSSVKMAAYFAKSGFDDITIAFPLNINEVGVIDELARRISLNVLVESVEALTALNRGLGSNVGVFVKIDTGAGRTGVDAKDFQSIETLAAATDSSSKLRFKGFLTHAGHSYKAKSVEEILAVHSKSVSDMVEIKEKLSAKWPDSEISIGDTPCCRLARDFAGVTELRPGNFVFYDVMQLGLGSCSHDEIACAVVCPIVAKHGRRNTLVVHGGAVHLSKEAGLEPNGDRFFGLVVKPDSGGWGEPIDGARVTGLSQEHGIVSMPGGSFERFKVGDMLGVLPVHSCLTANLMRGYVTLEGDIVDHMQGERFEGF